MRRTFATQAEFDAWHENAKAAAGLPVVGVNARTGQPAPEKQQTTDLTSLSRDEDGNLILEATITDDTLAARGFQDKLIRAGLFRAAEVTALVNQYPRWRALVPYAEGALIEHAGTLWACKQDHTSDTGRGPPNRTPDLWARV